MSLAKVVDTAPDPQADKPLAYEIINNNVVEIGVRATDQHLLQIEFGGYSTAGLKDVNQDAFAVLQPESSVRKYKGTVAAIADGVSCSERSQEASQLSVTDFISDYYSTPDTWTVKDSAARVLNALNSWLYQHGSQGPTQQSELVTTFSSVVFKNQTAHIFHAGDSRIYRLRAGQLEQLTRDHSRQEGGNNLILTNALGMGPHLEVDYLQRDLQANDIFLLSTDGVHDFLTEKELLQFMHEGAPSLESLTQLITSTALSKGSNDNLSCLLLKVTSLPQETPEEGPRNTSDCIVPPTMQPGMTIDGYQVLETLHSGTHNHIYLIKGKQGERLVLKAPSAALTRDSQCLEVFAREQWVGRRVEHPNIMRVHTRPTGTSFIYNVYEYIPSQNLRQWMFDNPNPALGRVRNIVQQIAAGLRAFQRRGMLHRDLRPENVLIDKNGRVKLIDFSTVQTSGLEAIKSAVTEQYAQELRAYRAPEYLRGEQGAFRSDIYSLGVMAYEMLCGELPYEKSLYRTTPQKKARRWQYRSLQKSRDDIPPWVDATLKKATAPSHKERYPALSELCQDLRTPNLALLAKLEHSPLLERNPLAFWKALSVTLFAALLVVIVRAAL